MVEETATKTPISFLGLKKQQALQLFLLWDENSTGFVSCSQLRPFLSSLFAPHGVKKENVDMVFSIQEVRGAFLTAVGKPLSVQGYMTADELLAVIDVLWASPTRRAQMMKACLYHVFSSVSKGQQEVPMEALAEVCSRTTGATLYSDALEAVFSNAGVAASHEAINYDTFCKVLIPLLCGD